MTARDEVLARIRAAHAAAAPPSLDYSDISRDYRTDSDPDGDFLVERLVDRLLDYKALVRSASAGTLADTVSAALTERGVRSAVVPVGLDPSLLSAVELDVRVDGQELLSVADLDSTDAVVTACLLYTSPSPRDRS